MQAENTEIIIPNENFLWVGGEVMLHQWEKREAMGTGGY